MKSRLNEITLSQYIELLCGNYHVLLDEGEEYNETVFKEVARDMISSYRSIVDSTGMKVLLTEKEDSIKCKIKVSFLQICNMLVMLNEYKEVRSLLSLIDTDVSDIADEQLKDKVLELLRYATFEQHRNENAEDTTISKKVSSEDIRAYYDAEIAFIMIYFKINIDMNSINTAVYANIVHQADMDIIKKKRLQ